MTWFLLAILAGGGAWFWYEKKKHPSGTMPGGLHADIDLPHKQEWELYHNSFSLCSKKARLCMAELGLEFENHPIELVETGWYQNVSAEYLAINPGGIVPTLVHNGHPIYESHDQIAYAAEHAGERGEELLPRDPELRALVEEWVDCASLTGEFSETKKRAGICIPALTFPMFATTIAYVPFRHILKGFLFHPHRERPALFLMLKFRGVENLHKLPSFLLRALEQSREHMGLHLDRLEERLEKCGGPWIAGEAFTLADVSWAVILDRLVEADFDGLFWGDRRPQVRAYWERLQARPTYGAQILEQRCQIVLDGMRDLREAKSRNPDLRRLLEGDRELGA